MLTVDDLQLARDVANDLRVSGSERKASAVEHLIDVGERALDRQLSVVPPDLLPIGQAARAIGLTIPKIKEWAAQGKFETVRLGDRTLVVRSSLLAYLDSLRPPGPTRSQTIKETAEQANQREFIQAGFPSAMIQRMHDLVEAMEERTLSADEEAELDRLERESARVSAHRLKLWITRYSDTSDR
jgi:hypothetical protein